MSVARRTATGFCIGFGVAALLWLDTVVPSGLILWGVSALVLGLAIGELARMGSLAGRRLELSLGTAAIATLALVALLEVGDPELGAAWSLGARLGLAYLLASVVCAVVELLRPPRFAALADSRSRARLGYHVGLALWLIAPFAGLILFTRSFGHDALVALIVLSKVGDVFGYFVGRKIGRRHPFPSLSKGKTTAGCVASLVAGTVCGGLLAWLGLLPAGSLGVLGGLLAGFVLNLAAQAGDLLESSVKRRAGVKDSGTWMGAAGGLLDVIDSVLLSVPAAVCWWPWIFR